MIKKNKQYRKFCAYGFLKNLKFYDPFIILFFRASGLSFLQIGTLYSIREISQNILEIPAGVIADSIGRKKSMMLCFTFYILSFIVFYFSYTFIPFVVAMLLYSFGEAFRTGTHKAMIFDYLKREGMQNLKVHYYGHTRSWSQIGSALSSLIAAGIVIYTKNYRSVFLFSIIPFILDFINIWSYPKYLDGEYKSLDFKSIKIRFKNTIADFVKSFKNIGVFKLVANTSVHSGYYKTLKDFIQPMIKQLAIGLPVLAYMQTEQKSALLIGIIYFVIYLLTSFSTRNAGNISDLFNNPKFPVNLTLIFGLMTGIISGLFSWQSMEIPAILFFILIYIIENIRKPMSVALISEKFDDEILATALSAESQFKTLITALLAPLLGYLVDSAGLGIGIMVLSGILLLFSAFLWIRD